MSILTDTIRIRVQRYTCGGLSVEWQPTPGLRLSDVLAVTQQPGDQARLTHIPTGRCIPDMVSWSAGDLVVVAQKHLLDLPWPTSPRTRKITSNDRPKALFVEVLEKAREELRT